MSIASEISRVQGAIADAYDAAEAKGATMPTTENIAALADCIESIPSGGGGGKAYLSVIPSFRNSTAPHAGIENISTDYLANRSVSFSYAFSTMQTDELDFSDWDIKPTNLSNAFRDCYNLKKIVFGEHFDTSAVAAWNSMFQNCKASSGYVKSVDLEIDGRYLEFSAATNVSAMFTYAYNVVRIQSGSGWVKGIALNATSMEHDAIVEFLQGLPTISDSQTMTLGATKLGYLSAAEKAIATGKGWTLA